MKKVARTIWEKYHSLCFVDSKQTAVISGESNGSENGAASVFGLNSQWKRWVKQTNSKYVCTHLLRLVGEWWPMKCEKNGNYSQSVIFHIEICRQSAQIHSTLLACSHSLNQFSPLLAIVLSHDFVPSKQAHKCWLTSNGVYTKKYHLKIIAHWIIIIIIITQMRHGERHGAGDLEGCCSRWSER